MAGVMLVVEYSQREAIVSEVQRRGEVLARSLAATSTTPLLLYNFTALEQNVTRIAARGRRGYAIVLDGDGRVAAHSRRPDLVGRGLDGAVDERARRAGALLIQEATRPGRRADGYDIAVPVRGAAALGHGARGPVARRMDARSRRRAASSPCCRS